MTPEMFDKLIKAIDSTDWTSNWIQIGLGIFSILIPIIYATWISKKDTKEIDERQQKLEIIQNSIANNILELTGQQKQLSDTQKKVEESLRELKAIAQQSRKSNLIKLQNDFPIFFRALDDFEWEYSKLSKIISDFNTKKKMSSDVKDEVGEIFIAMEDMIESEINHLNNSEIPPIILGSFNKLLRAINSSSKYDLINFDDIQCTNFIFDEFSRIKIAREELLMFLNV
jgi:hypothetical protein